jgi:hypothetical protein
MRWLNQAATWLLLKISSHKWGIGAVIMPVIVRQLGPFSAIRWMSKNIPKYEKAMEDMGPISSNLMFAIASLLNGCAYCTYAHGRAFELYYFEKYNKLFPLDDHQLINLIPLTDEKVRGELENALIEAGLPEEVEKFRRLYAIKLEGLDATPDDHHLVHAIGMYDFLNFCAIESQTTLDEAHDRVNKDSVLKARYAEARLEAGRKPLTVEDVQQVDEQVRAMAESAPGFEPSTEN